MATTENSPIGGPYRSLSLKLKDDLKIAEHVYLGAPFWVVGDPISLEFYRFNEQEFSLLNWCDGKRSIDEIKELFEEKFAPHQIKHVEIQNFSIELYQKTLLVSTAPDQGRHLYQMGKKKTLKRAMNQSKNVLAIKWKGINPDKVLNLLAPLTTWFFSKPVITICILVMLSALGLVVTHFAEFSSRLPSVSQFFSASNLPTLVCVVLVTKIIHELAHGLVLKRFGGMCHELGVMLLVGIPTLYINTSDSWRFTNKWQRAAVGAAGIYIELLLAAVATWTWWLIADGSASQGAVEYVLLNVMVLSTMSTVLFNGNPLLRFDGYFVLCDLVEIPNLADRSGRLVRNWFLTGGLGVRETDEYRTDWQTKFWLFSYWFLSFAYKVFIAYVIAFILVKVFRPFGLEQLAKMFGIFFMVVLACLPLIVLGKYFWTPGRTQKIKRSRLIVSSCVLLLAGAFVAFFPFPEYVNCTFSVAPENLSRVYANHDSVLSEINVQPGATIEKDAIIGKLRSIELELQAAETKGRVEEIQTELSSIERIRFASVDSVANRTKLEQNLIAEKKKLLEVESQIESLTLIAPTAGVVMPTWQNKSTETGADDLETWHGESLRPQSLKQTFHRGQTVCEIGDPNQLNAKLVIDQFDVSRLHEGQQVRLMLNSHTAEILGGVLRSVSQKNSEGVGAEHAIAFGGSIESRDPIQSNDFSSDNQIKSARPVYEGLVELNRQLLGLSPGQKGNARIRVGDSSLGTKFTRFLFRTFRFEL